MDNQTPVPPQVAESASQVPHSKPIRSEYTLCIHFQPDLPFPYPSLANSTPSVTAISSLATQKRYHSQFTTGISNGGLLATSARIQWEEALFGDFYGPTSIERPKYGAILFPPSSHSPSFPPPSTSAAPIAPYGPTPRFGSSYLRLKPHLLASSTFAYPESSNSLTEPIDLGTAAHFSHVEAAALTCRADVMARDPLDWYIEAHVHSPIHIPQDVEAVVLDPAYRGSSVEADARRLGCAVEWHRGYRIDDVEAVDWEKWAEYRNHETVEVAKRIVQRFGVAWIDPVVLGWAYVDKELRLVQQQIKRVWHCLARFGRKDGQW